MGSLVRLLADADVQVEAVLSADDLAQQLLRTYEPHAAPPARRRCEDHWPMAMEESWSEVRVDGMVHATFWVAEWPRIEVRSDFLAPLLLGSARSTLAVVMEPLGPDAAVRKVEASRTADLADAELRRRGGFVSTARHARESEVLARREAELAEGHASFRYSGYVTVSAPSEEELVAACDVVQHAAGQSRLALRRLYGDQASAYTCTLPLCRGLRLRPRRTAATMTPMAPCPTRTIPARTRRARRTDPARPAMSSCCCSTASTATCSAATAARSSRRRTSTAFARERAVRFTSHVTGSLPCMPARHDILCGSLDFLWRPWGSIEVWEEPITAQLRRAGRDDDAGVGPSAPLRDRRRELPHRLQRLGLRARPRGRPVADLPRPELHRHARAARPRRRVVLAGPARLGGRGDRAYDRSRTFFRAEEDFPGPRTMRTAADWLRDGAPAADAPFLLFVDEFDPHEPFDTPEPWAGRYDPGLGGRAAHLAALRRRRGRPRVG